MKALLISFLLFFFLHGGAEGSFLQAKAAFHVHTRFSTGALSLEEVVAEARAEGIDSVIFAENFLLRFEYGLFPFRSLVKKVVEKPSVLRQGIGQWLRSLEMVQAKSPDVILIPGVEVVPFYYWTGSPFRGDFTMWDAQKNMLVVGLGQPGNYLKIPAIGNGRLLTLRRHLLGSSLGLALVGLGFVLVRTGRQQKIARRWVCLSGWLALGCGALVLLEALSASGLNPYLGDLGIGPYQRIIDAAEASGGMVFWSFPEARDLSKQSFGPAGTVTMRTDTHPEVLLQSHGYTGFGGVYQDNVNFTNPGGEWDQLLLEYAEGRRARPAWAIGELGYHGAPKRLDDVLTVFLVPERSKDAILAALKGGRFYAVQSQPGYHLTLEEFSIGLEEGGKGATMGGELVAPAEGPLFIRLRVGASDGREVDVGVRIIQSGKLLRILQGRTPFSETVQVPPTELGRREFFRIEVVQPRWLLSNPIFIRRQA